MKVLDVLRLLADDGWIEIASAREIDEKSCHGDHVLVISVLGVKYSKKTCHNLTSSVLRVITRLYC